MKKFEYHFERIFLSSHIDAAKRLSELGNEGWELKASLDSQWEYCSVTNQQEKYALCLFCREQPVS